MFLIALGFAGLVFGLGSGEVRKFENSAASDIAAKLQGEHRKVMVRTKFDPLAVVGGRFKSATITASDFAADGLPLFTEPEASKKGRLDELKLSLNDFTLGGLKVKRLEARIPDCRFDFGLAVKRRKIRLSKSGEGLGWVEVEEAALAAFVLHKFREIKSLKIRLDGDRAHVEGYGEFLIFNTNFVVDARLATSDGNQLMLVEAAISFDGKEADPASSEVVLKSLNPVVDLDKDLHLYGAIRVSEITMRGGILRAEGKTRIPDRPAGTKDALSLLEYLRAPVLRCL